MSSKSDKVRGLLFGAEFFTKLNKEVFELGGDEELIHDALKTDSDTIPEIARLIVEKRKDAAAHLQLVNADIVIKTEQFQRDDFFRESGIFKKGGLVALTMKDSFKPLFYNMPAIIPPFEGSLIKTNLTGCLNDAVILAVLGKPRPLTLVEFAAVAYNLLSKQPHGEGGLLLNNNYEQNLFYVQVGRHPKSTVTVTITRCNDEGWCFFAGALYITHDSGKAIFTLR